MICMLMFMKAFCFLFQCSNVRVAYIRSFYLSLIPLRLRPAHAIELSRTLIHIHMNTKTSIYVAQTGSRTLNAILRYCTVRPTEPRA